MMLDTTQRTDGTPDDPCARTSPHMAHRNWRSDDVGVCPGADTPTEPATAHVATPGSSTHQRGDLMAKNVRVTPTKNRVYPYTWRCTVPDERSYTGECGTTSFARTEHLAKMNHASHMAANHREES